MNIEFMSSSIEASLVIPKPRPAEFYMPEWYKKMPLKNNNIPDSIDKGGWGVKACTPFKDAMINGYIQETWTDINIFYNEENNFLRYDYSNGPKIIGNRETISTKIDEQYYNFEFFWRSPWIPKIEKGYSILFTHPLNHTELPFMSLSGIIDSDEFYHVPWGNFPFYIKKNFTGIIPAGTPMYQMIPIKRDSWESSFTIKDENFWIENSHKIKKHFIGSYKKFFNRKKIYR